AFHLERRPRVVCEHEHGYVIRRIRTPPTLPVQIRPWAAHGSEHITAKYPRTEVFDAARGELVVDPANAAALAEHLLKRARRHEPGMQILAADAEWVFERLLGTRSVAVERNRKTRDFELRHCAGGRRTN